MPTFDEFLGGWLAGIGGLIASHPFDTIKIQHQNKIKTYGSVLRAVQHEGIQVLYKGMFFPSLVTGVSNALYFGIYSNMYRSMIDKCGKNNIARNDIEMFPLIFCSGVYAGAVQVLITAPVENIKIQKQMYPTFKKHAKNVYTKIPPLSYFMCCKTIYKAFGLKGFYRGFVACFYRDVPTSGIHMTVYVYNDKYLCNYIDEWWSHFISGGVSGFLSNVPGNPFDVIKSRMQSDNYDCPKYSSFQDCVQKTYKETGYKLIWRGLLPSSVRAIANNAVIFVIFELYLRFAKVILKHEL